MIALTGAAAAAKLGLDGFRDLEWPTLYCAPISHRHSPDVIRTRLWREPEYTGDLVIAHPSLVLRHLGCQLPTLRAFRDVTPMERVELAVEHALREGIVSLGDLRVRGSSSKGDELLAAVLRQRGVEPPTESFAETRAAQHFRAWGITAWRQAIIFDGGRARYRADFAVAYDARARRPDSISPTDAVLVEVDSRAFHADTFDQDHEKQMAYQLLGFSYVVVTPNQLSSRPGRVRKVIERALSRPPGLRRGRTLR